MATSYDSHREDVAVGHRHTGHHQANRRFAFHVARQRRGAAIEEVHQTRIAQDAAVPAEIGVVAGDRLGNGRRDTGRRWHEESVERRH